MGYDGQGTGEYGNKREKIFRLTEKGMKSEMTMTDVGKGHGEEGGKMNNAERVWWIREVNRKMRKCLEDRV